MPKAEATINRNLVQRRKKSRSTTTNNSGGEEQTHVDSLKEQYKVKTELAMATVEETHKIYTDQTGKFPITYSRGNKYILIMYVYDDNAILSAPLKSRSGSHILEAYIKQV